MFYKDTIRFEFPSVPAVALSSECSFAILQEDEVTLYETHFFDIFLLKQEIFLRTEYMCSAFVENQFVSGGEHDRSMISLKSRIVGRNPG